MWQLMDSFGVTPTTLSYILLCPNCYWCFKMGIISKIGNMEGVYTSVFHSVQFPLLLQIRTPSFSGLSRMRLSYGKDSCSLILICFFTLEILSEKYVPVLMV